MEVLEGKCWNNLALAGDKLLVRNHLEAVCLELPSRGETAEPSPQRAD